MFHILMSRGRCGVITVYLYAGQPHDKTGTNTDREIEGAGTTWGGIPATSLSNVDLYLDHHRTTLQRNALPSTA